MQETRPLPMALEFPSTSTRLRLAPLLGAQLDAGGDSN